MSPFSNDEITLDYQYFLKFTGWNSSTYKKRTMRSRIDKLKKMGACDIHVKGNGTKAIYNMKLAPMFWPVFLATCQGIEYNVVAETYLRKLISEGSTEETTRGKIALFSDELYQDITSYLNNYDNNYGFTHTGVKTKCDRIRTKFKNVGYFNPKDSRLIKTHRAKADEGWLRGRVAYTLSESILNKWREFFKDFEQRYLETYPEANVVPPKIKGKAAKDFQLKQLPFELGISHSQPCIEKRLDEVFFEDFRFAEKLFFQTHDLQHVKRAILDRQKRRSLEIQKQEEARKRAEDDKEEVEYLPVSDMSDRAINSIIAELYKEPSSVNTDAMSTSAFHEMLNSVPFEN